MPSIPPLRHFAVLFLAAVAAGARAAPAEDAAWTEALAERVGSGLEDHRWEHELEATPQSTLADAVRRAMPLLERGESVRVTLTAGEYPEDLGAVLFDGRAVETALAIVGAGAGQTILTGADRVTRWEDLGDGLYATDWDLDWGNWAHPWESRKVVGQRAEMVFVDGMPMRPVVLETYDYNVSGTMEDHGDRSQRYAYTGFVDPRGALKPGEFGVAERDENGNRLYLRVPEGVDPAAADVRVTRRRQAFHFTDGKPIEESRKDNLVLGGLTFTRYGNRTRELGPEEIVGLGYRTRGLHVEGCAFVWNSGNGLKFRGSHATLRDNEFLFNGFSGLNGEIDHLLMEGNRANFNNWRGAMGGQYGWWIGGVKLHGSVDQLVRGHESIGNNATGLWYDVHNRNIFVRDLVSAGNRGAGLFLELSRGPFLVERALVAHNGIAVHNSIVGEATVRDSILHTASEKTMQLKDDRPKNPVLDWVWYRRQDEHARQDTVVPVALRVEDCVLLNTAESGSLIVEHNGLPRDSDSYAAAAGMYAGRGNLFFASEAEPSFAWVTPDWQTALGRGFEAWRGSADEHDAAYADPGFADSGAGDFTLAPGSPLVKRVKELPTLRVDPTKLGLAERFQAWTRGELQVFDPAVE